MAVINVTAEASDSTRTYIKTGGHSIVIDEPPLFGGEDTAPEQLSLRAVRKKERDFQILTFP